MAGRLPSLTTRVSQLSISPLNAPTRSPLLSLLAPQFHRQQTRNASILSTLSDTPGAYNKRIRRGRGPASGKGKTSGRGHKGQKQHGKVPYNFNGGQTPESIVHGERGFTNYWSTDLITVNLDKIQEWIDQGRIDPKYPITVRELFHSNCVHQFRDGIKLLGRGKEDGLKQPIHIVVSRASADAIAAIEAAGGSVTTRFYTNASIKRILMAKTHPFYSLAWSEKSGSEFLLKALGATNEQEAAELKESKIMERGNFTYRLPDPTHRKDIEYYRDPAHRGYLSHLVKPSEGPSLFFLSPAERKSSAGVKKEKTLAPNRLW
ncbi:50S ribosomal protein L15 [Talaromyces pinophilus]|nr:50S ribosomal protein L15 [Talaromyces pinophilus]